MSPAWQSADFGGGCCSGSFSLGLTSHSVLTGRVACGTADCTVDLDSELLLACRSFSATVFVATRLVELLSFVSIFPEAPTSKRTLWLLFHDNLGIFAVRLFVLILQSSTISFFKRFFY